DAILEKQVIQFTYHSSYGASSTRTVEPLQLLFKGSAWYLIGYCTQKQAQRYFKLNRMENLQHTKEHFQRELDTSNL
ncbi:WYL domain-containing protein, partial [Erysipelatoclostridium ramosum]